MKTKAQKAAAKAVRTRQRGPSKEQARVLGWLDINQNWLRISQSRFTREKVPYFHYATIEGIFSGPGKRIKSITLRVLIRKKWIEKSGEAVYCGGSKNLDGTQETISTWEKWVITKKGRNALWVAKSNGNA